MKTIKYKTNLFPERLKEARIKAGMTREELEDKSGVSTQCIARYENGYSQPRIDFFSYLVTSLRVSSDWLLGG